MTKIAPSPVKWQPDTAPGGVARLSAGPAQLGQYAPLGHARFGFQNSTPELFRGHLREAISRVSQRPFQERIVFLKAWNEWAEGNHVEPDLKWGRGYLEVIRQEVGP